MTLGAYLNKHLQKTFNTIVFVPKIELELPCFSSKCSRIPGRFLYGANPRIVECERRAKIEESALPTNITSRDKRRAAAKLKRVAQAKQQHG